MCSKICVSVNAHSEYVIPVTCNYLQCNNKQPIVTSDLPNTIIYRTITTNRIVAAHWRRLHALSLNPYVTRFQEFMCCVETPVSAYGNIEIYNVKCSHLVATVVDIIAHIQTKIF